MNIICSRDLHLSYVTWNHSGNTAKMVKNGRSTSGIRTNINAKTAHSKPAVTVTHIPMKKIGEMTNIGLLIDTTTAVQWTIVEHSMGLTHMEKPTV